MSSARVRKDEIDLFLAEHRSVFLIRCSFCDNEIQTTVPQARGQGENQAHHNAKMNVIQKAKSNGWRAGETNHGNSVNACPQHVNSAQDIGLVYDDRPKAAEPDVFVENTSNNEAVRVRDPLGGPKSIAIISDEQISKTE